MKTKALISCAVSVQLFCAFVFAYAKSKFPHGVPHIILQVVPLGLVQAHLGLEVVHLGLEVVHLGLEVVLWEQVLM